MRYNAERIGRSKEHYALQTANHAAAKPTATPLKPWLKTILRFALWGPIIGGMVFYIPSLISFFGKTESTFGTLAVEILFGTAGFLLFSYGLGIWSASAAGIIYVILLMVLMQEHSQLKTWKILLAGASSGFAGDHAFQLAIMGARHPFYYLTIIGIVSGAICAVIDKRQKDKELRRVRKLDIEFNSGLGQDAPRRST